MKVSRDYRGEHQAPRKDSGAPLWDLTQSGIYPVDVYSVNGPRYYGIGDGSDGETWRIVLRYRNHPSRPVRIYRAAPRVLTNAEKIAQLDKDLAAILRRGRLPPSRSSLYGVRDKSDLYEHIKTARDRLSALPPSPKEPRIAILPGDWVSLDRRYVVEHGHGALRGSFRILSKVVPASAVYTNGDSILEWGYDP